MLHSRSDGTQRYRGRTPRLPDSVRWHGLLCRQACGLGARESQLALAALQALAGPAAPAASRLLEEIATLYDLPRTAAVLRAWAQND